MPYARPTLSALQTQAQQDITASPLPGADGLLSQSVLNVMALVQAGQSFLQFDYLDWISRMANPWSAEDEYAAAWGALVGVFQKDATTAGLAPAAPGIVTFPSVAGNPVPAGTPMTRSDGASFVSTSAVTATGATVAVPTAAVLPGAAGNTQAGQRMFLSSPVPGISSTGSCTGVIVGGAPQETAAAFKARYLQQYAAPPHGGDRSDYIEWALAVPGVTRAWIDPNGAGPGTVVIYTMFDQSEAANGGFPVGTGGVATGDPRDVAATGDQLTVANALFPVQPVTALVYSESPINTPVSFVIQNLSPNTPAVRAGINAALADMFVRLDQVGGSVNPDTGAAWGTIYPSDWQAAVGAVAGIGHFTVAAPAAPITPGNGQLLTFGSALFSS